MVWVFSHAPRVETKAPFFEAKNKVRTYTLRMFPFWSPIGVSQNAPPFGWLLKGSQTETTTLTRSSILSNTPIFSSKAPICDPRHERPGARQRPAPGAGCRRWPRTRPSTRQAGELIGTHTHRGYHIYIYTCHCMQSQDISVHESPTSAGNCRSRMTHAPM